MPARLLGFISRVLQPARQPKAVLRVVPREAHPVSRNRISPNALKVLYRLKDAGYEAYLVGGGVRDLLLGNDPKDFDVATSATPDEVRREFRNCRLVGRRFRLAHILFGREVIEVATFRAAHLPDDPGDDEHVPEEDDADSASVRGATGMLLRDNVWGTVEEDAIRRDFTVNALYYNIRTFAIHDYVDGLRDLEKRRLRLIGDPETRYREDPVRMLRAARFAAKLGFSIDRETERPIKQLRPLLHQVPPARLFDESLKLLLSGYGRASWEWLERLHLDEVLFPDCARHCRTDPAARQFVLAALDNSDSRIREGKSVTPAFLFAALLWPEVSEQFQGLLKDGVHEIPAMAGAAQHALDAQCRIVAIPRRFSVPAREIWDMQLRLPRRQGKRAESLLGHPRFRAAYDFLLLRESAGALSTEAPFAAGAMSLGEWWSAFQEADPHARHDLLRQIDTPRAGGNGGGPDGSTGSGARKRRRRRRKPA